MKTTLVTCLFLLQVVAKANAQTEYTGIFKPTDKPVEFIARSPQGDSLILHMASAREAAFTLNNRNMLLHYSNDGVTVSEDSASTKITYIRKGMKSENGKTYTYRNVKHWEICLTDKEDGDELVKGNYEFSDNVVKLTVWVKGSLSNPEVIAMVVRSLIVQTQTIQQDNEWFLLAITTLPAENASKLK